MSDLEELRATLASTPDWDSLNAYEMTKRCCAELTKRGRRLPSWMNIRDIIGKGSANDINRGKEDFRREHGDALRKMSGFVKGVPEALAPHILGFWTAAISLVREEFDGQVAEWQAQIERAEAAVAYAEDERDQAVSRAEALQGQIAGLQEAMRTLQGRVDTERAAREQAERMFESNRQELAGQRDELRAALDQSQKKLGEAISRLEGVERRSLLEIDRARGEAKSKVAEMQAHAEKERTTLLAELNGARTRLVEFEAQLYASERKAALSDRELSSLRERLQRAEGQVDRLTAALKRASTPRRGIQGRAEGGKRLRKTL